MSQIVKAFQQHAENFLAELKIRLFDGKNQGNSTDFAELFSMFVSSCEKVLVFAIKRYWFANFQSNSLISIATSVCDEPKPSSISDNQEKIYSKISELNQILHQSFEKWAQNLSNLRLLSSRIIQLTATSDEIDSVISQILSAFQNGAIIHCGSLIFFANIKFEFFCSMKRSRQKL